MPTANPAMTMRTITNTPIDGIVLAGGLSTRMGRDKALLPWHGRTLLEHMRGLLRQAGCRRVWVSGNYPAFGGIADRLARCGPLGGLYSVAMCMPECATLVLPVDMPNVTPGLLQRLFAEPKAACTLFADEPLPMRLHIDDKCRRVLQELIEKPPVHRSLRAVQERLGAIELPLADNERKLLLNCNSPADLESIAS